jgi:hypothetical protein
MKRLATGVMMAVILTCGCHTVMDRSSGNRDDLIGWYRLPNRHYRTREVLPGPGTLIPVFKRDGVYYSICRGSEVPLKVCPEGLEWGPTESSMKGTKIGVDQASGQPYIVIDDANAQYEADYSTYGEKQFMTRIRRPFGLLNPTTRPPRSNDDFRGCYLPVWFPVFRWIVRQDGGKYHIEGQTAQKDGWRAEARDSSKLEPLPDRMGFAWGGKQELRLLFNHDLHRFECASPDGKFRMPLARVNPSLPPGTGTTSPPMDMGIPSWH